MERRLLLATALMIAVLVLPTLFIKPAPRPARPTPGADTARAPAETAIAPAAVTPPGPPPSLAAAAAPPETVSVETPRAHYRISTAGGALVQAELAEFVSFSREGERPTVQLLRPGDGVLAHRFVLGADTLRFDSVPFAATAGSARLALSGALGGVGLNLSIAAEGESGYLLSVSGALSGLEGRGGLLMIHLGSGLDNVEADSADNYHQYGVVVRRTTPQVTPIRSLDPGERATLDGPYDWVAVKSKYFIAALLSPDSTRPSLAGAIVTGLPRASRQQQAATTWVTMPVGPDGRFRYQLYLGPQEYRRLHPMGRQLDRASPYGWIFKPIVMPVASWITMLFIWVHENLKLTYGMVLVVFGVLVRLVLWPLNQKAMKSQVAMQAVQPILKDLQTRHKDDPQKLQQEMMKVYREHKVNPLGGCLPMFLPLPVLLALFFVFAYSIELRGVPFLWLPDLSRKDPLYIIPLLMGGSMWAVSKLGTIGMPPNPQMKMMTVVMPIMMTVLFLNFSSGVNLYYTVSNLVSLPQQYLINKARAREVARRQGGRT